MTAEELLTIGRFARISGLTAHTLRHYDEVGLLTPADVDPRSGYRRYRREQVRDARVIQALRGIDLPIEEVKEALGDPEGPVLQNVLRRHRDFGKYGDPDFFLVHLHCPDDYDRVGPSNFGLLVEDLDAALARAVDAGAVQVVATQDPEGMPRCCAVKDPSGNWIWLYQG